jgi:hypothetical protein
MGIGDFQFRLHVQFGCFVDFPGFFKGLEGIFVLAPGIKRFTVLVIFRCRFGGLNGRGTSPKEQKRKQGTQQKQSHGGKSSKFEN